MISSTVRFREKWHHWPQKRSPFKSTRRRVSLACIRGGWPPQVGSERTCAKIGKTFSTINRWPSFATFGEMCPRSGGGRSFGMCLSSLGICIALIKHLIQFCPHIKQNPHGLNSYLNNTRYPALTAPTPSAGSAISWAMFLSGSPGNKATTHR